MRSTLLTILLALVGGFIGAAAFSWTGLGNQQVESYLLDNPDILPKMVAAYEQDQAEGRLAGAGDDLREPFQGAVLGNPNGKHTLIKFTDYNCGYCRTSSVDVQQLIAADPELKVVIREWPIFEGSERAARLALAAGQQGKYAEFHAAIFGSGNTDEAGLMAAAQELQLDIAKLEADAASAQIGFELSQNTQMARELGFTGTPSWVVGDTLIEGAVPAETLAEAIAESAEAGA